MAVKTGALQWLTWDTQAGAAYKCPGLVVGGSIKASSQLAIRRGAGNQGSHFAGPVGFGLDPQLECTTDSKALLQYAIRSAGALTALKFKGGVDTTNGYDFLQETAYINQLRVSGTINGPLVAALDILSTAETEAAVGGAPIALGSNLYPWEAAVITVGGAAVKVQSFDFSVNNNMTAYSSLDSKSAAAKRIPVGISPPGNEEINLSVNCLEKMTWGVGEDTPAVNLAAVITYTLGTSIVFTFASLAHVGDRAMPFVTDTGLVIWKYDLLGIPGSLVIT